MQTPSIINLMKRSRQTFLKISFINQYLQMSSKFKNIFQILKKIIIWNRQYQFQIISLKDLQDLKNLLYILNKYILFLNLIMRKSENLHNSQCSQPKPKIVYKNLQQIIKKSSSVQKKKSDFQLQNQNKEDQHLETFNTQVNYTQPLKQSKYLNKSNLKLSRTSSRHSLQSKQKINFFSSQDKVMKTLQKNTNPKKSAYNRADAIFTDLQDFLRQAKQVVLNSLQKNDSSYSQKELDKIELSIQQLKNSIKFQQKNENLTPSKQFKAQRTSEFNCFQDYIMNRQTTLTSTINGDTQGNIYMGTQTDDELMNCLAFKNKISRNNPNRKIHITQQLKGKQLGQKTVYELVLQQSKKKKTRL